MNRKVYIVLMLLVIFCVLWPVSVVRAQDGQTALDEGFTLLDEGDPAGALERFESALQEFQQAGNRYGEGDAAGAIAMAYYELGQPDQALEYLQQGLIIYREVGERVGEADVLNMIGMLFDAQGNYEQALSYYLQALPIFVETGELFGEGDARHNLGMVYISLGRYEEALDAYQELLERKQETGAEWWDSITFQGMAMAYSGLGQYDQSLDYHQQTLEILRLFDAHEDIAIVLQGMAWDYLSQEQYTPALDHFMQALDLFRELDNMWEAAASLGGIATVYTALGQYDQALDYYMQVLEIAQAIGDWMWAGETLLGIGQVFYTIEYYDHALNVYLQAVELYQAVEEPWWEAVALGGMAWTHHALGQYDQALIYFEQTLNISRELGDRSGEGDALNSIGQIYGNQGDFAQALDYLLQALDLYRETGNRPGEADALSGIGTANYELGQYEQAIDYFEQAVAILAEVDRSSEIYMLGALGWLYEDQGRTEEAVARYARAVDLIEAIQADIRLRSGQVAFAGQAANVVPYDRLVTLLASSDPESAFNYAERARARSFLYQLGNEHLTFGEGADAELMDQWQVKRDELTELYQARINLNTAPKLDPDAVTKLMQDIARAELELAQIEDQIALQNPALNQFTGVDVPDLATIQATIPEDTTMLAYYVTEEQVFAFILTRSNLTVIPLEITSAQLSAQVVAFSRAVYSRDANGNFVIPDEGPQIAPLRQLHTWLYAPLEESLTTTNLIVVPHDVLNYLPFVALTADGAHYLLDDFVISYVPSAAVHVTLSEAEPSVEGTPLVLAALPPEYFSELGAQIVADQLGVTVSLGDAATESLLRDQISAADVVHVAAHGYFDRSNPLSSYIALSSDTTHDGSLEVREIYTLPLHERRPLVVLVSCETAAGRLSAGDDFQGLNRAFLLSGAREVIASLWLANDYATAVLTVEFYANRERGMSDAEALAVAQRTLLHVYAVSEEFPKEWRAPFFWATLVLNGVQ